MDREGVEISGWGDKSEIRSRFADLDGYGVGHWEWWIRHWESRMGEEREAEAVSRIGMAMGTGSTGWGLLRGYKKKGHAMEEEGPAKVDDGQERLTSILSTSADVPSCRTMSIGETLCPLPNLSPIRTFTVLHQNYFHTYRESVFVSDFRSCLSCLSSLAFIANRHPHASPHALSNPDARSSFFVCLDVQRPHSPSSLLSS